MKKKVPSHVLNKVLRIRTLHWWQLETAAYKSLKKVVNCSRCFNKMSKKRVSSWKWKKSHKQVGFFQYFWKRVSNSKLTFWVMNFFIFSADMQKRYEMFALCIRVLAASTGFHRKFTISVFLSKHLFFIMGIYFTPLNEMGALYNRYVWCTAV